MGSAIPSRVSLLISILRLNLVHTYGILPSSAAASIYETAVRHRVSPEFIGSRNCLPMAFTAESPAGTGPVNLKVVPNECCLGRSPWTNLYSPLYEIVWYRSFFFQLLVLHLGSEKSLFLHSTVVVVEYSFLSLTPFVNLVKHELLPYYY